MSISSNQTGWLLPKGYAIALGVFSVGDIALAALGYLLMGGNLRSSDNPDLRRFFFCCILAATCAAAYALLRAPGRAMPTLVIASHAAVLLSFAGARSQRGRGITLWSSGRNLPIVLFRRSPSNR